MKETQRRIKGREGLSYEDRQYGELQGRGMKERKGEVEGKRGIGVQELEGLSVRGKAGAREGESLLGGTRGERKAKGGRDKARRP